MPDTFTNYYEVLNVSDRAGREEIKKAFRTLAKRFHPDANPERKEWAEHQMKLIMTAYHVLVDERLRCEHDTRLRNRIRYEDQGIIDAQNSRTAATILQELLNDNGKRALQIFDKMRTEPDFSLLDYMSIRDYLDSLFLLAEQLEKEHRYMEALRLYEELYQEELEPPRQRYFFDELCERIKNLYTRKLVKNAGNPEEKLGCYRRVLEFDFDKATNAFVYKKMAEVYLGMDDVEEARLYLEKALKLKPGLKGISKIMARLETRA